MPQFFPSLDFQVGKNTHTEIQKKKITSYVLNAFFIFFSTAFIPKSSDTSACMEQRNCAPSLTSSIKVPSKHFCISDVSSRNISSNPNHEGMQVM